MAPPALTFVIPAYNAEATLAETLDSLIAQTRGDWNAIVVDDCSADATFELAQRYADRDPRIRAVRNRVNGRVCRARNQGLCLSETEWVCFLDSDDWVAADYCEKMLAKAGDAVDFIYCGYRRLVGAEQIVECFSPSLEQEGFDLLAHNCAVSIHCVVMRRSMAMAVKGFDPELEACEDWDLWQRLARAGARFAAVPESLAIYRAREGSLSRDNVRMLRDGLIVLQRGHGADPRVAKPAPAHANGVPADWLNVRLTCFAAWCAGAEVGAGGDGAALLSAVSLPDPGGDPQCVADTLVEAMAVGSRTPPARLIERLPALRPQLDRLIAHLATLEPRAGAARGLTYAVERELLDALPVGVSHALTLTAKYAVRLDDITAIEPPDGVDLVILEWIAGGQRLGRVETAVIGGLSRADVMELALAQLGLGKVLRATGLKRRGAFWNRAARRLAVYGGREARRLAHARRPRVRSVLRAALADAAVGGDESRFALAALAQPMAPAPPAPDQQFGYAETQAQVGRAAAWEQCFATPDPWNYSCDYERQKYDLTLELVGDGRIERAAELGCAEGLFTERLARRVERLIAADISTTALSRAKARCAAQSNVSFVALDVAADAIPAGQDLILCSEMLYYLDGQPELRAVAEKLRDALAPGGRIVTANHFLLKDDPTRTGFDWEQNYGGQVICDTFAAVPGLVHERAVVTELYRIDVFRRAAHAAQAVPEVRHVALDCTLEPSLARYVVWGGARRMRRDAMREEETWNVPVLAYHRIAEEGPEALRQWRVSPDAFRAQLRLLRANGYYSVTSREIAAQRAKREPFPGRPVLISFDDGYQDFADAAWPILEAEDFTAEVFIVTDRVGQSALWDAGAGTPAPLMSWDAIEALGRRGARFGSHLASHTPAPNLSSRALVDELQRSRAELEARVGQPVVAIAAPYGAVDERYRRAMQRAGYEVGLSCDQGVADIRDELIAMPRIEVSGRWSIEQFAAALDLPAPDKPGAHEEADLVTVVIPAYNAAATIDETLRSVRAQTHANLEILVVDDGSADATAAIVQRHCAQDRRVRLIRQWNAGVAAARNRGIGEARAALIAPVDADDLWAPTKIEQQLAALRRAGPKCALVYTWYAIIDEHSQVKDLRHTPKDEGDVLARLCRGNVVGNGSAPLMRKAAILQAGGYEPGLRAAYAQGCEDLLLYFRIAERHQFAVVQEHLTAYRQLGGAMSGDVMQMLRSYRIVAAEMRRKYPAQRAAIRWGEAHVANWLMYKAIGARRLGPAARLAWATLATDPAFALTEAAPGFCRVAARRLRAALRASPPALKRFLAPAGAPAGA